MSNWKDIIGPLKKTDAFIHAYNYQKLQRQKGINVFPPQKDLFNAFSYTPFSKLKVVIIGQDPYHEKGQAMGLSFSVPVGTPIPPSLRNIYRELQTDIPGFEIPNHGNLIPWARQGVLLLNAVLSVDENMAGSHRGIGWEEFTDDVIMTLKEKCDNLVFILWGGYAQKKGSRIDPSKHLILNGAHPSPLSANRGGFFGNHYFSRTNQYLLSKDISPIDWRLPLFLDGSEEL